VERRVLIVTGASSGPGIIVPAYPRSVLFGIGALGGLLPPLADLRARQHARRGRADTRSPARGPDLA
jgi:hypothetical protein